MTQYEAILRHLRKHGSATVRDLLKYTNYPSARIFEMEESYRSHHIYGRSGAYQHGQVSSKELIERWWMSTRNGKRVRLYKLVRGK
jgi:hypothetical protein